MRILRSWVPPPDIELGCRNASTPVPSPRCASALLVLEIVIQSSQPGCQSLNGNLVLGMHIDELTHALGKPGECDMLLASAREELLDAAISEVHA